MSEKKEVASLSTMSGSGVFYTTTDDVKYNVRALKVKWHTEFQEDELLARANENESVGRWQFFNIESKRDIVFKWFSRLVFNQTTGKPMTEEEFGELDYDDVGAILVRIMRLSD